MKVAFISQPWNSAEPPAESGSVAIWIYQVTQRLAQSCDVIVYGKKCQAGKSAEFSQGVQYRYVSNSLDGRLLRLLGLSSRVRPRNRPYFSSWLYYFAYIVKVALDLRKADCDIVHIQNLSQFVPIVRALNPRIKIVLHMHCQWLTQLDRTMIRRRLEKTDLVLGCSEYVTGKVRRCFPSLAHRCRTLYNGVDVTPVGAGRRGNGDPVRRILFVGRISPEKGLHVLLEAFREIAERCPEAQLDIVGPRAALPLAFIYKLSDDPKVSGLAAFCGGDYLADLRKRLTPELMKRVSFSGVLAHSALAERYAAADLYVQPSFTETFGVPIAEAMAAGVPVVATRVGGMPEAVEDGRTGRLVEPDDAGALAEAVVDLLSDEGRRRSMGEAARRRAVERFSWEQITRNVWDLYQGVSQKDEGPVLETSSASILSEDARPSHCQVQ